MSDEFEFGPYTQVDPVEYHLSKIWPGYSNYADAFDEYKRSLTPATVVKKKEKDIQRIQKRNAFSKKTQKQKELENELYHNGKVNFQQGGTCPAVLNALKPLGPEEKRKTRYETILQHLDEHTKDDVVTKMMGSLEKFRETRKCPRNNKKAKKA